VEHLCLINLIMMNKFKEVLKVTGFFVLLIIVFICGSQLVHKSMSKELLKDCATRQQVDSLMQEIAHLKECILALKPDSLFEKEWFALKLSIADVESNGNHKAVGLTNDVGIFQITPIYIKEANRLSDYEFTDSCRYDIVTSNLMFEIVNAHYNPEKDIYRTIRGHNPGAGDWYKERIMKRYNYYSQFF
jgi:hypothetical protein